MTNELLRQGFHAIALLIAALLAYVSSQATTLLVYTIALVFGLVMLYYRPRPITQALMLLDRPDDLFVAKGAITAFIGAFVSVLLFPEHAPIALVVLAVGDSAATVVGKRFGRVMLWYNSRASLVGSATFFVISCVLLLSYTPYWLVLSVCATILESIAYPKQVVLDDNVVLPIAISLLLSVL